MFTAAFLAVAKPETDLNAHRRVAEQTNRGDIHVIEYCSAGGMDASQNYCAGRKSNRTLAVQAHLHVLLGKANYSIVTGRGLEVAWGWGKGGIDCKRDRRGLGGRMEIFCN